MEKKLTKEEIQEIQFSARKTDGLAKVMRDYITSEVKAFVEETGGKVSITCMELLIIGAVHKIIDDSCDSLEIDSTAMTSRIASGIKDMEEYFQSKKK